MDRWALQFRERIEKGVEALGHPITQGGCASSLGGTKVLPARREKAKLTIRPTAFGKESTLTMTSKNSAPAQLDPIPLDEESRTLRDFLNAIHPALTS